jgi:hypothetical protein
VIAVKAALKFQRSDKNEDKIVHIDIATYTSKVKYSSKLSGKLRLACMNDMRNLLLSLTLFFSYSTWAQTTLLPGTIVYQTYLNGEYIDSLFAMDSYTIRDNGNCRLEEEVQWKKFKDPELWRELRKYWYTYNSQDRIATNTYGTYDKDLGDWVRNQTYYYTYSDSLLTEISWSQDDGYSGSDNLSENYTYNDQHKLIRKESFIYYNHYHATHPSKKTEYHYDNLNRLIADTTFNWSVSNIPIGNRRMHYNTLGLLDSLWQNPNSTYWPNNTLDTYEYDNNGFVISITTFIWNNGWTPITKSVNEYDNNQQRLLFVYKNKWNNTNANWQPSTRIKFGEFCKDDIETEESPSEPPFRLYPNPGKEFHLMPIADIRNENTIHVRDIRGIEIFTETFQWPHLDHITQKSRSIPPGFYFITITGDNYRQDLKWVKVE